MKMGKILSCGDQAVKSRGKSCCQCNDEQISPNKVQRETVSLTSL